MGVRPPPETVSRALFNSFSFLKYITAPDVCNLAQALHAWRYAGENPEVSQNGTRVFKRASGALSFLKYVTAPDMCNLAQALHACCMLHASRHVAEDPVMS